MTHPQETTLPPPSCAASGGSEPLGSGPHTHGPRLASVVVFVHDLDASADFYGSC